MHYNLILQVQIHTSSTCRGEHMHVNPDANMLQQARNHPDAHTTRGHPTRPPLSVPWLRQARHDPCPSPSMKTASTHQHAHPLPPSSSPHELPFACGAAGSPVAKSSIRSSSPNTRGGPPAWGRKAKRTGRGKEKGVVRYSSGSSSDSSKEHEFYTASRVR